MFPLSPSEYNEKLLLYLQSDHEYQLFISYTGLRTIEILGLANVFMQKSVRLLLTPLQSKVRENVSVTNVLYSQNNAGN